LFAECASIGLFPDRLWIMTLREIFGVLKGARMARVRERQLALWTSWNTEAFARQKRLPDIVPMLRKLEPMEDRAMTPKQVREGVLAAFKQMGAKVTHRKRGG
jgi:hypothetical protein